MVSIYDKDILLSALVENPLAVANKKERERAIKAERESGAELEKLRALSSEQQSVIQTNMNKSPTNQTEAYMQHELTR